MLLRFHRFRIILVVILLFAIGMAGTDLSSLAAPAESRALAPSAGGITCQVFQPGPATALDAYIKQDKQDERRGGDSELRVKTETGKLNRSLLRFDLSSLPAGSVVQNATLSLYVKEVKDGDATIRAHSLTNSWNEAQVTWKARDKAANLLWTSLGGDFSPAILDSVTVVKGVKNYWASWNVTAAANAWLSTPASNHGLILESPVTNPKNETKFKSSDDGTASQRPKLELCYSAAVTLTPNNSGAGVAGQTRTYSHVLTVGQTTGDFWLSASSTQGWTNRIYRDLNGNGIKEVGDTLITTPLTLGPNVTFPILIEIDVPPFTPTGSVDVTTVTAFKLGSSISASASNHTQVGGIVTLQPDNSSYAVAGSVIFYGHTLTNNSQAQDCYAVSAHSSEGWTVLLWDDVNKNGVHETSSPNEPPLASPVCLQPGQTQYIVAEVQAPAGAGDGVVDTTTITAVSANEPGKSDSATDVTHIFVNDPPVIDGKYDDIYRISPDATEVCYTVEGVLFGKLATFYLATDNAVYMVLAIDKDFVDNTYGANAVGWPSGHTFSSLVGSDRARFIGYNADGVDVLEFDIDYISTKSGTPSGYDSNGLANDGGMVKGSAAHILQWGSSLAYNLNELGYCAGGNCSGLGTNLLVDSPATDAFYTPNDTYPDWIFDVIYEVKIDIAAFGASGFGSMDVPYIHASPSKLGTNTIVAEPGVCPGQIGDTVWHDANRNGNQDAGESGLSNVTVRLYRDNGDGFFDVAADTLVGAQTTNANGNYLFKNLVPGDYFVVVDESTTPAGWSITTFNNPTPLISLGEGQEYLEADFGYTEPFAEVTIEKTLLTQGGVFVGQNVQFNIRVTNTGTTVITTLPLEDYYDTAYLAYVGAAPASDDNVDDGALNWSDLTASFGVNLAPGASFNVVLTFETKTATLGTLQAAGLDPSLTVGAQTVGALAPAAEPVVDGLLDSDYNFVGQVTSPVPGRLYGYEGASSCYWTFVVDRSFNDNVYADSDSAYLALAGWGSHKFNDLKGSDKAAFEITYPGGARTINLDYLNGTTGAWTSGFTGGDGSSSTPNPAGSAAMTSLHWNLENSNWNGGPWTDPLKHSPPYNYNQVSGQYWEWAMIYEFSVPKSATNNVCGTMTLASAHNSPSKHDDKKATIGDRVWEDANRDGVQDGGEVGLPGVRVELYQNGVLVRVTETEPGTSGYYLFNNLNAGTYTVDVVESSLPTGYGLTSGNEPMVVNLASGQNFLTADFGYYFLYDGSIGDRVFYDVDGSGLPDDGVEPGIAGVTVNLYAGACPAAGAVMQSQVTDANGNYTFVYLPAGAYCVVVDASTLPDSLVLTTANQPLTVNLGEDEHYLLADFGYRAHRANETCDLAAVTSAMDNLGNTAPAVYDEACVRIQATGSIGDYVWNDANGNGLQDEGPGFGLDGVRMYLYVDDGDGVFEPGGDDGAPIMTETTASDGRYTFDDLPPGSYWVTVEEADLPGFIFIPGAESGPKPHLVHLGANEAYEDADFGYAGIGTVSGTVFFDWSEDGIQDLGEPGIEDVQVCLYHDTNNGVVTGGMTPIECQQTGSQGEYLFENLLPGPYLVQQAPIPGLDTTTGRIRTLTLIVVGPTGSSPDNDFGNVAFGSIGDFVFLDSNGDGIQQPTETTGISGVPITVTNVSTLEVFVTSTNQNGFYLVGGLIPGTYEVTAPATWPGLVRTTSVPIVVNLALGEDYVDADFGYIAPTSVQLVSFTAASEGGAVVLRWSTASEQDVEGFRIWRAAAQDGAYKAVSPLIAAANDPAGNSYQWVDASAGGDASYWYKIESVPDGALFGPVRVIPEPGGAIRVFIPLVVR